jgi:Ser/Thr protein kinase RdoA (MazF antagonist)
VSAADRHSDPANDPRNERLVTDSPTLDSATVAARCAVAWGVDVDEIASHRGGMNSRTWLIREGRARYVAKAVPAARRAAFEAGLRVASIVEAAGIPAGAPLQTIDGQIVLDVAGFALALLRYVEGSELTGGSEEERAVMGSTLGRAHLSLLGRDLPAAGPFPWLDPRAGHATVRPWVGPAIDGALAAWEAIVPESLTWAPLHTDPAPEAFRLDRRTGVCGLIDWDLGVVGPLLYDLASAQMYVGGPARAAPLLAAYLDTGALTEHEVDRALPTLTRLRWAVQADYFARRIATDDLTGIEDRSENETGLEDARRALLG